jgi:hypothetical protein
MFAVPIALTCALLAGCMATVPMAGPDEDARAQKMETRKGTALLYLYRDQMIAYGLHWGVALDGVSAGSTVPNSYMVWRLAPGRHVLTSETESRLEVVVRPDEKYYVWQDLAEAGGLPRLHLVAPNRGAAAVATCKLVRMSGPDALSGHVVASSLPDVSAAQDDSASTPTSGSDSTPTSSKEPNRTGPSTAVQVGGSSEAQGEPVPAYLARPSFAFFFGVGSAAYQLRESVKQRNGMGRPVPLHLFAGVSIKDFFSFELGGGFVLAADKMPFCEDTTGGTLCSSVFGVDGWLQASVQYPLRFHTTGKEYFALTPALSVGGHGFSIVRGVDCGGCSDDALPVSAGPYLASSIKLTWGGRREGSPVDFGPGFRITFERPFDADLSWALWFHGVFDFVW